MRFPVLIAAACWFAQTAYATPHLTPAERDNAFKSVVTTLQRSYVFPEKVPAIAAALAAAKASGRYDNDDPVAFATRLSEDLESASKDHHLYVLFDPAQYAARKDAKAVEEANSADFYRALAARTNSGLVELKILPGNIRYLRITGFQWIEDRSGAAYNAAFQFLKEADAVVIDIRGNGGGDHGAVRYLISHFLKPGTPLMTFLEAGQTPEQSRVLDYLPDGRMVGKPLAVLIDGQVASAAEDFSYSVQQFHIGTLVGSKTVGAANNNKLVPIAPGFLFSVSYGRPEHPVSHSNWEQVGVAPDVEASPAASLDTAQAVLLKKLLQTPQLAAKNRAEYEWALTGVEARLNPPKVAEADLQAKVGRYGEEFEVSLRQDSLWYVARPGAPLRRLIPLNTSGLFAIEGREYVRVQFTASGLETYQMGDPNPRRLQKR